MKRILSVLVLVIVSGVASADIAIELKNASGYVRHKEEPFLFVDRVLVQLIWTSTAPTPQAGIGGTLGVGEILLNSLVTNPGFAGTWPDQPQGVVVYGDVDVGNVDINNGYFVVRMYDNSALGWGDFYLQQAQEGSPLAESPTTYDTSASIFGGNIDSQGFQIVPEPAVASLFVVFGGGMLIGRRIFSRG